MDAVKEQLLHCVEMAVNRTFALGCDIFDHPECGGEERYASTLLTRFLEENNFTVERGVGGMETAFRAVWERGSGGPSVGMMMEYDALPNLGHACGHHLQSVTAISAALALREACPEDFKLVLYGTPDEEGNGGKIFHIHAQKQLLHTTIANQTDNTDFFQWNAGFQAAPVKQGSHTAADGIGQCFPLAFYGVFNPADHIGTPGALGVVHTLDGQLPAAGIHQNADHRGGADVQGNRKSRLQGIRGDFGGKTLRKNLFPSVLGKRHCDIRFHKVTAGTHRHAVYGYQTLSASALAAAGSIRKETAVAQCLQQRRFMRDIQLYLLGQDQNPVCHGISPVWVFLFW